MRGHGSQWISHKINIRHPLQLKKSKSWEPLRSYQLNSTANQAHLPQNQAKLAKSAALFSWQIQNGSQDFDFFNCNGCRTFILCEIHCYVCPQIFWVYYFSLSQCEQYVHMQPERTQSVFGFIFKGVPLNNMVKIHHISLSKINFPPASIVWNIKISEKGLSCRYLVFVLSLS